MTKRRFVQANPEEITKLNRIVMTTDMSRAEVYLTRREAEQVAYQINRRLTPMREGEGWVLMEKDGVFLTPEGGCELAGRCAGHKGVDCEIVARGVRRMPWLKTT